MTHFAPSPRADRRRRPRSRASTSLTGLLAAGLVSASLLLDGGAARALSCGPPPPDPVRCLCDSGVWQQDLFIGYYEWERFPPNREITRFVVEQVFTRADEPVTVEAGDVLELSDELDGFSEFERHETIVGDYAVLAWFTSGDSGALSGVTLPADQTLTVFGYGLDDERQTAEVCTTPVPASDVATALLAADCWSTLRELAPEIPKPPSWCRGSSTSCGAGPAGSTSPWWPAAGATMLLAALLRRRRWCSGRGLSDRGGRR